MQCLITKLDPSKRNLSQQRSLPYDPVTTSKSRNSCASLDNQTSDITPEYMRIFKIEEIMVLNLSAA